MGFPGGASGKEPADIRDSGLIPGPGSPGRGYDNPLQYFAWRIPWTEEPAGLLSIGSQRVRHDFRDLAHMPALGN